MKKKIGLLAVIALLLSGCMTEATTASNNLSREADSFNITRRIVFFNGITDTYLLSIEGKCSIEPDTGDNQLEVTCKHQDGYKKHFLGLSDNVTYFVEQMDSVSVSEDHYLVVFRPQTIVPNLEIR